MTAEVTRTRRRFRGLAAAPAHGRRTAPADAPRVHGLRPRRPRDLAGAVRLLRVVFYDSGYPVTWPETPREWLVERDELGSWVVERHDEVLGHVALSRLGHDTVSPYRWREMTGRDPSDLAAVTKLFVRPRVRREGIGTALLETAVAEAHARGLTVVLQVPDSQHDAVRLYQAQGWRLLSMDLWGGRDERRRMLCYLAPPER